ncbi:MAG: inositol-3-phosphate synthase [Syntrophobacteraceae bacterium]|nr:inositol-3-phosphate synthase [Syntrophobacteraceae bacterium]
MQRSKTWREGGLTLKNSTGAYLIGALGSIATTVAAGTIALGKGLTDTTGMITSTPLFEGVDLADTAQLVLGGCDIRKRTPSRTAPPLLGEATGISPRILEAIKREMAQYRAGVQTGIASNCGEAIESLCAGSSRRKTTLRNEIKTIRNRIRKFRESRELDTVVVVNLASTEPPLELEACHHDLGMLEQILDDNGSQKVRASTLYAYAAIREGCPYINFTPSNAALFPAMAELAQSCQIPVMGDDGKTGETLVKSALAPMFTYRNLDVMSWMGFNILGNMDGQVLDNPGNLESKIRTKDRVLSKILGYSPHSKVKIDYVPSLGDRKTAWDFIHFRGFLGAEMSMQFVWQGLDSLLAAPLVLDMIRLAEFSKRRGEAGLMPQLASFFKAPIGVATHGLPEQFRMLADYAEKLQQAQGLVSPPRRP